MASVYDIEGSFEVTRLRCDDATFLSGASRTGNILPPPIARATGPRAIFGPSGAVGANETWGLEMELPGAADLFWVLTRAEPWVLRNSTGAAGRIRDIWTFIKPIGVSVPLGSSLMTYIADYNGGSFDQIDLPEISPPARRLFIPIDPYYSNQSTLFSVNVLVEAPATGLGVDSLAMEASNIEFLGYPANAWNTGSLWSTATDR